jgi:hypothetical protein
MFNRGQGMGPTVEARGVDGTHGAPGAMFF